MKIDPLFEETDELHVAKTFGGHLLVLPLPKRARIAQDFLDAASEWVVRHDYTVTFRALNVRAVYRLETLERGTWVARLIGSEGPALGT